MAMNKLHSAAFAALAMTCLPLVAAHAADSSTTGSANSSTASTQVATHAPYSSDTPVGTLMDDPKARPIVVKIAPIAKKANTNPIGRTMSLRQMQPYAPDQLSDETLAKLDAALAKLNADNSHG